MSTPHSSDVYDSWHVRVGGHGYGPYTHAMMVGFVREGRVTADSHISADPAQGWFSAAQYPQWAEWTAAARPAHPAGQSATSQPAHQAAPLRQPTRQSVSSRPVTRHMVMAEIRSGRGVDFLRAVQAYMQATRIGDAVWLVDGAGDTDALTAALRGAAGPGDRIFVADITGSDTGQYGFLDSARSA